MLICSTVLFHVFTLQSHSLSPTLASAVPRDGNLICGLLMRISEVYKVTDKKYIYNWFPIFNIDLVWYIPQLLSGASFTFVIWGSRWVIFIRKKGLLEVCWDHETYQSTLHINYWPKFIHNLTQSAISTIFEKVDVITLRTTIQNNTSDFVFHY